jgi:2-amino-4-hydroxy-6-hydroxymethyldihydropteridine diphosphokinase
VIYVVGLGSNLGDRRATLRSACDALAALPGCELQACSALYETEPVGPPQPRYLNAAVRLASELGPRELLACLLEIERRHGRQRRERNGPRTLDLDILWASRAYTDEGLTVPHARLPERAFALAPLLDVAPELEPIYGPRLHELGGQPPCQPFGASILRR